MGNVNMEAYQVHYRGDESVADHLRKIDLDVEKAAALPDLPTEEGKKVLTAITDDQGETELTYETPEVESEDIAPAFSEETAYSEGDLVYYEGNLYKFTDDHAAGSWDPSEVTPTSAAAEFNELKSTLGNMRMSKLWENSNPNVEFTPQNITLNSGDYDLLLINFANTTVASSRRLSSVIIPKGYNIAATIAGWANNAALNFGRYITYVSDTVLSAGEGYDSNSSAVNNTRGVPIVIYGIKLT